MEKKHQQEEYVDFVVTARKYIADATGVKDGAVKIDGKYYFFDSYGVCQSGLIKFTSGGKTETAYFDPEAGGDVYKRQVSQ